MPELRPGWDIDSKGNQKVPRLSGVCASETMNHRLCGGWFCICDCHDGVEIGSSFTWAEHVDHDWQQVGPCVYCCGHRLYQGETPDNRDERAALAEWWDVLNEQTEAEWAEARRRVAAYKAWLADRSVTCCECGHPITFDTDFGWLHDDFHPEGRSFDHIATPAPPTPWELTDGS